MVSEYTPTTAEVREAIAEWAWSRRMFRDELAQSDGSEFDRWHAKRTPTRDDMANVLAGAYDEWCVLLKEFLAGRVDDPGSEYEYKADAVLALLAGLAEGES